MQGVPMDANELAKPQSNQFPSIVTRRTALRGLGGATIATALGAASVRSARAAVATSADRIEPHAGEWKTWLLSRGDQFRPAAPPDEAAIAAEDALLRQTADERDAAALDR